MKLRNPVRQWLHDRLGHVIVLTTPIRGAVFLKLGFHCLICQSTYYLPFMEKDYFPYWEDIRPTWERNTKVLKWLRLY